MVRTAAIPMSARALPKVNHKQLRGRSSDLMVSFGFTGGHFHWNWGHDDFRRLVTNAILWTAGDEIDDDGSRLGGEVGIEELLENQDYDPPKNFNRQKVEADFQLSSTPAESPSRTATKQGRELFATPLVDASNRRARVDIETPIRGVSDLYLVVTDGGNGFSCDWADWIDPVIHSRN